MTTMILGAAYGAATLWTFRQLAHGAANRAAYIGLPLMIVLGLATGGSLGA